MTLKIDEQLIEADLCYVIRLCSVWVSMVDYISMNNGSSFPLTG